MAFIEKDGSLRNGHEIFNRFCGEDNSFRGKINIFGEIVKKVVEKCKIEREIDGKLYNLYVPSGDMKYKGFWIRDASYIAESGFVKPWEIKDMVKLIASRQNKKRELLKNGLMIPEWAIPDHINFDGDAVYFPGTYKSGINQGNGAYGFFPPHDNQYFFIELVYRYFEKTGDFNLLKEEIDGIPLFERLSFAFQSYNIDEKTQLCFSNEETFTIDWGFCDTVWKSGLLLFPSLLRYKASLLMEKMAKETGEEKLSENYGSIARKIKRNIMKIFWDGSGWLLSATKRGRQHDVVGTLFAIQSDIIEKSVLSVSLEKVLNGYVKKSCVDENGYVRFIPDGEDFSRNTSWEKAISRYQEYQNGGYWAFATGWYIYALSKIDLRYAEQLTDVFLSHTLKHWREGAPFEWENNKIESHSGCFYGASAALPFKFIKKIKWKR